MKRSAGNGSRIVELFDRVHVDQARILQALENCWSFASIGVRGVSCRRRVEDGEVALVLEDASDQGFRRKPSRSARRMIGRSVRVVGEE